jgi:glutaminase
VLAIAPGRMAIAVYSAPLDAFGNSVRGCAVVEHLAKRWNLHSVDRLLP